MHSVRKKEGAASEGDGGGSAPRGPTAPDWQSFGTHRFYVHTDVLFWEVHGPTLTEDIAKLYEQRELLLRTYGYALVLIDTRQHGGVPPEARRYAVMNRSQTPPRGSVVVFGASLLVRTILSLIMGAARRLGRTPENAFLLAPDEAAAWTMIARSRQQLIWGEQPPR